MSASPAGAQDRAGLRFARFERYAGPPEFAPQLYHAPIVRALVQEQRLARRNTVNIDGMLLEFIRKRLLHVQYHSVNPRCVITQTIEDSVYVFRVLDGAIEVGGEPI